MASHEEVRDMFVILTAAYPNIEIKPNTMRVYASLLLDLPGLVLNAAAQQVITECKFFPTVAEIRAAALGIMERTRGGDGIPTAADAWAEVMQQMREVGATAIPALTGCSAPLQFSHPLIRKAVDAMGWYELCMSENEMADRAHFMKFYDTLVARERDTAAMLPQVRAVIEELAAAKRVPELPPGRNGRGK